MPPFLRDGLWRRGVKAVGLRTQVLLAAVGVAKPYSVADRWAGAEVLDLRLQALCRQALLGLLCWQLVGQMTQ